MPTSLINLGPFAIYLTGLLSTIGIFFGLYYWWKLGRDEHLEEDLLFDSYFLSLVVFIVMGRATYVILHLDDFQNIYRMFGIMAFPGIDYLGGILASLISIWIFARYHDWDLWQISDNWVTSVGVVLVFGALGGVFSSLKTGGRELLFAGLLLIWSLTYFTMLIRIHKNYRFYDWYKKERTVAPNGLPSIVALGLLGVIYAIFSVVIGGEKIGFVPISAIVSLTTISVSAIILMRRVNLKFRLNK